MQRLTRSATYIIAAITVVAWLVALFLGQSERAAYVMGFIAARFSLPATPFTAIPAILTPLTATLVHASWLHIGFNLLIFIWCGAAVERVLGNIGLVILYLVGAYAAALLQYAASPHSIVPMVGASGAISAVIGAYALTFGRAKRISSSPAVNRWLNVAWLLVAWVVLQAMMGWLANGQGYLLATPAHVGGFVAGLLLQRPLLLWRYRKA